MKCPLDSTDLLVAERSGVEIDYCPACRGVWLDRGELDKIIERSADSSLPAPPDRDAYRYDDGRGHGRGHDRGHGGGHDRGREQDDRNGRRRRGGLLGDLFDL